MHEEVYLIRKRELCHHGIKGQKWGVRRFQKKDGSLTSAGKKRYSDGSKTKNGEADSEKRKGLSDKQKKAIKIGAAAVATGLAIYGGYKLSQVYKGAGSQVDPITGFRFLKDDADRSDISKINPGRIKFLNTKMKNKEIIGGSSTNCMLCTTAYELRQRGYDVHAGLDKGRRGFFPNDLFPNIYTDYKDTTKLHSISKDVAFDQIENFVKNEGHGSRGNIMVWWDTKVFGGGGHSMIWENVNGKVVFKDGQTGQIYENFKKDIISKIDDIKPVEMLRTDNLTLNTSEINKYVNKDTLLKTYVDHGAEITATMANDPVVQIVGGTAALGVMSTLGRRATIKSYREQHPNTKLTDEEIIRLSYY